MSDQKTLVGRAKVAGITAESQISLNAGTDAGLQMGDLVVLNRHVEVRDPETSNVLGSVAYARLNLTINLVGAGFSIAVVTDRYFGPPDPWILPSATPLSKLKTLTSDPTQESDGTVLVTVGEDAVVYRINKNLLP